MNKNQIKDWSIILAVMQIFHTTHRSLTTDQVYRILRNNNIIRPDGLPTKFALKHRLVIVQPNHRNISTDDVDRHYVGGLVSQTATQYIIIAEQVITFDMLRNKKFASIPQAKQDTQKAMQAFKEFKDTNKLTQPEINGYILVALFMQMKCPKTAKKALKIIKAHLNFACRELIHFYKNDDKGLDKISQDMRIVEKCDVKPFDKTALNYLEK